MGSPTWRQFLVWSVDYLGKYWPKAIAEGEAGAFVASYEAELAFRVKQGGRGLWFLLQGRRRVGIANAYIADGDSAYLPGPVVALHVAELYVIEEWQRQGLGKCFLDLLIQWGLDRGARALVAEVDKDLKGANSFWESLAFHGSAQGERNVYVSSPLRRLA